MVKVLTASTSNIDDTEAAAADIKSQLDLERNLLKHSVGIAACHYEFVLSGAFKAVCDALPFDVAGTISSVQGVNEHSGTLLLTLFVISSDDASFKTILTDSLKGTPGKAIEEGYKNGIAGTHPSLMFAYAPFMVENSGDEYVNVLTKISGGVPCFGTLAVDDTTDFRTCYMLYNGECYRDRMSIIFVYGQIRPKFYLASLSEGKLLDQSAVVTASEGHVLKEVNGRPVIEYFENLGLTKASETAYAMTSLPFMLDYMDGTPLVSKIFISLNEDKHAVCAGAMPEGSTLYLGVLDKEDVLLSSRKAFQDALAGTQKVSGILIYSCISRFMALGSDLFAEIEMIRKEAGGKVPFLMAYSGGEICPTRINQAAPESAAVNRFHNNTFILCIF
ncbi:MAG: FIST C-terminal domain-containing protein [Treponema sp.]|nr:FIST C-terminal domain-containing protein [Treponema sp.]